jgi:hypothetical protein
MRNINEIAMEIASDWKNVNYGAVPYLEVMFNLRTINDKYYDDDAKTIIIYFLANASTWRGETAKRIKTELKQIIK